MIAISIAHAAHKPERAESLMRMLKQITPGRRTEKATHCIAIEREPGKPHEWSLRQWTKAIEKAKEHNASHCVMLNDDLVLCDDFVQVVLKVAEARPEHIVNLYNSHPIAKMAYAEGLSWLTTPEGLIGNAYMLPTEGLIKFLEFREKALIPGAVELLSEDQLINLFAMATRALIWHTVPALVDHDTSIESCYGNTQIRRPEIPPQANMLAVNWDTDAMHAGLAFKGNFWWLIRYIRPEIRKRMRLIERAYELFHDKHVDVRKIA